MGEKQVLGLFKRQNDGNLKSENFMYQHKII